VRQISARGGGYRELPIYESTPARTVNNTPIPSEFIFVETTSTGQPVAAWRVPNDPAVNTTRMAELPQYRIDPSQIPEVMLDASGNVRQPGSVAGPAGTISGFLGSDEEQR
jgi:hypothetical protein